MAPAAEGRAAQDAHGPPLEDDHAPAPAADDADAKTEPSEHDEVMSSESQGSEDVTPAKIAETLKGGAADDDGESPTGNAADEDVKSEADEEDVGRGQESVHEDTASSPAAQAGDEEEEGDEEDEIDKQSDEEDVDEQAEEEDIDEQADEEDIDEQADEEDIDEQADEEEDDKEQDQEDGQDEFEDQDQDDDQDEFEEQDQDDDEDEKQDIAELASKSSNKARTQPAAKSPARKSTSSHRNQGQATDEPGEDEDMPDADVADSSAQSSRHDEHVPDNANDRYFPAQQSPLLEDDELDPSELEQLQAAVRANGLGTSQPLDSQPRKKTQKFWSAVTDRLPSGFDSTRFDMPASLPRDSSLADVDMDDSDVEIGNKYHSAEAEMTRKRKHSSVTETDEIQLLRLKQKYDHAMRRAKRQEEHEAYEAVAEEEGIEDDEPLEGNSLYVPPTVEDDTRSSKKQKRNRKPATAKTKGTPAKGKRNPGKKPKVKKLTMAEQARQRQENAQLNFASGGLASNVFTDVNSNRARTEQPTFSDKNKRIALHQLIASIPEELQAIAKMDRKTVKNHLRYFTPSGSCRSDGHSGWKLTGLISSLSHYQMIGVGWMRNQETAAETDEDAVPGGLIADAMGLGKTVMCLANIVNGRPKNPNVCKTTLIVVPNSLVTQWQAEIKKHAGFEKGMNNKGIKSVGLQFSKNRIATKDSGTAAIDVFKKFEIVLTTYSEVCREFPKYDPPPECRTREEKKDWWDQKCAENPGPLHSMTFHRVILDEATAIKNHMSATSLACRALRAKYRWAVSGTPAQNNTAEFYPYFKFLQVPNTGSFKVFKQNFCGIDEGQGRDRLYHVLRGFMLKRNHADELFGSKLLPLPKPTQRTSQLYFTKVEAEIYHIVHRRFVDRINGYIRAGVLKKKYSHVLAMITRLRQLTCHPLLVQDTMRDLLEPEDFRALEALADRPASEHEDQAAILSHLRRMLSADSKELAILESDAISSRTPDDDALQDSEEHVQGLAANASASFGSTATQTTELTTGRAFAQTDNTHAFLAELEAQVPLYRVPIVLCSRCKTVPKQPVGMKCGHSYCNQCTVKMSLEAQAAKNRDKPQCLDCKKTLEPVEPNNETDLYRLGANDSEGGELAGQGNKKPKKMSAKDVVNSWVDAKGNMVPSSKTTAVKAQILAWQEEKPGVKIVIYTQFLTMVRILDKMCKIEGWGSRQLHGGMARDARDKSIKDFDENPDANILISTLKTGGMGLNLIMACRVIMIDLWWNSSVEHQAFCRTYRRGQTEETVMRRLTVHDSIDDSIVAMQERKDREIDAVMNDNGRRALSTSELMQLFGKVQEDRTGNEYIVVPDDRRKRQEMPHLIDDDDISGDEI